MPNLSPDLETEVVSSNSNDSDMPEYISVGEALQLITPFKGEKMY
jgi:hypothetical protein